MVGSLTQGDLNWKEKNERKKMKSCLIYFCSFFSLNFQRCANHFASFAFFNLVSTFSPGMGSARQQ
jgi:hypothetical protein